MKKRGFAIVLFMFITLSAGFLASAAEVTGQAQYTTIGAYINNCPINGYAVNGKIAVVAEDLRDYGFTVDWEPQTLSLKIERNQSVSKIERRDVFLTDRQSGETFSDLYKSDIKAYYQGNVMESYSLNGYTLILLNDLGEMAGTTEWKPELNSFFVWIDGIQKEQFVPIEKRCVNIYYQMDWSEPVPVIDDWIDMDCDGQREHVILKITGKGEYDEILYDLHIGESEMAVAKYQDEIYGIKAIYICDLIPNDHAKEIAVFTLSGYGDTSIHMYQYQNKKLTSLNFLVDRDHSNPNVICDSLCLDYVSGYPFILHDDGSFTLQLKTTSNGMWQIYETYRFDSQLSLIKRDAQTAYPVVQGTQWYVDQWGFAGVKKDCIGYGLPLYKGDRVRVLEDDQNNHILIEKNSGEKGWFTIGDWEYQMEQYSDMFVMAG